MHNSKYPNTTRHLWTISLQFIVVVSILSVSFASDNNNNGVAVIDRVNLTDVYCEDPGGINHSTRRPNVKQGKFYPYQFELHFTCDIGYKILQGVSSNRTLVCGQQGKWQPSIKPRCRRVLCVRPVILHGHIQNPGSDFSPRTKVQFGCDVGYRLQNKFVSTLECTSDGAWIGHNGAFTKEMPVCVEATCAPLPDVMNSILRYTGIKGWDHGFKEGSLAKYDCLKTYRLTGDGNGESSCHNGSWVGSTKVTCERLGCNPPVFIANGEVEVIDVDDAIENNGDYAFGMSIMYFCDSGYALMGSSEKFKCMPDGHWSPQQLPVCRKISDDDHRVQCLPPPEIVFGYVQELKDEYFVGSKANYACHVGFRLIGSAQLICGSDGQWEPITKPSCEIQLDEQLFDMGNVGDLPDVSMQTESSHHNMLFPTLDSSGAQTLSFVVAGCVMGILFMVLFATVLIQRHGCSNKLCLVFRSSANGNGTSGALHEQSTCHDQDRAALIAFTDGVQVALPTYEEATSGQMPSEFVYNNTTNVPVHRAGGLFATNCHNRYLIYRGGNPDHGNTGNVGGPTRHLPPTTHSCRRSLSLADSLGSMDTVTLSEVSTTVTVDTLSSAASRTTPSLSSTRAFCGSLTSFDTVGSGSNLNTEGVPLLEESEAEKTFSQSDLPSNQIRT